MKVNPKTQEIVLDQALTDVKIEDLQEELPTAVPRYIVFAYKYTHKDERVEYPLSFIFYSPPQIRPDLAMMYSSSINIINNELQVQKIFNISSVEELTEEWLLDKLKFFGV